MDGDETAHSLFDTIHETYATELQPSADEGRTSKKARLSENPTDPAVFLQTLQVTNLCKRSAITSFFPSV